ncbi:MAG TPA: cytochrome C oxidase subunit IV family protein [bacterium]
MATPERDVPILPARTFVAVWTALVALTATTVAVAKGGLLARYSVLGALAIASLKAGLVVGWFMHLRYESRLLRALVLMALAAVGAILALTFADVWYRR